MIWWWLTVALAGPVRGTFADETGRTARYALTVPEVDRPGLLLYFHHDGGERRYARYARGRFARLAQAHGLVVVSVQEPDEGYWWAPRSGANSRWVAAFLGHLEGELGFDPDRVFFAGLSGGAGFAAGLPAHTGFRYGGGVVALCGADIPRVDGENTEDDPPPLAPVSPPARQDVRLYFAINPDDELRPLSEGAARFYDELGIEQVVHVLLPGQGHCDFRVVEELERGLLMVDPPAP